MKKPQKDIKIQNIEEFIKDLNYIDKVVPLSNTNVFLRLGEIKDKWKSKEKQC